MSAIALPIVGADGAEGAINLVFFSSAMTTAEAARRFLAPLRECIEAIRADLARDSFAGSDQSAVVEDAPTRR